MDAGQIRLHPFDPASGVIPEIAEFGPLAERSDGRGIILIAAPDAESPDWCPHAAAALAERWSTLGARILLADASLTRPVLHEVFGLPNSEGITDVLMNDAQLRTVGRTVGSPKFPFISAGTPIEDVAGVMRSSRWDVVLKALRDADVHLVMYAAADVPGLSVLLERNPAVLLLAGSPEAATAAIAALGLREPVALRPPLAAGVSDGPGVSRRDGEGGEGNPEVTSTEFRVLELVSESSDAANIGMDSLDAAPKRSYLRGLPQWKWALALGLLALLAWAGSRWLSGGPNGSSNIAEEREESVATQEPVESAVPEEPAGPAVSAGSITSPGPVAAPEVPQLYSLSLAAFGDVNVAMTRAEALASRRPDVLFTTVPVSVSGSVFHRILAGPATDSAAAEELRTSLSETLVGDDASVWIVRATPLAFALGDYESRNAAERRAEEIPASAVASYVFEVGSADRPSFRVYAGAFADSAEAAAARERLVEVGEEMPQLVRRSGRYVAEP